MYRSDFLSSKFGIVFDDLYNFEGLKKLDKAFIKFLSQRDAQIKTLLLNARINSQGYDAEFSIRLSRLFEVFLVELFNIDRENFSLKDRHHKLAKLNQVKVEFVKRDVAKRFNISPPDFDATKFRDKFNLNFNDIDEIEISFAEQIFHLINRSSFNQDHFDQFSNYAAWALYSDQGRRFHRFGSLFKLPSKIDRENLVNNDTIYKKPLGQIIDNGFNLSDHGHSLNQALDQANYCLFCHKQNKDSCRSGLKENPGCPLDQKISEMNLLKAEGLSIASLAIAVLDNPMIAGTGHRICNDCMKSCIFQKQDPVNIPQIESRILKDVLSLPYGFEIYSLLTRWNPLNLSNPYIKPATNKNILICGLGPAGFTLALLLLNQGHNVVAIDGLKIEPLNPKISGRDKYQNFTSFEPIKYLDQIYEPLSSRSIGGFGGVVEYGITSRWDKNYLKIIRLLLERRQNFKMYGGLRFGSSITEKIAFEDYGFDHVALCIGAGAPKIIDFTNNFAKGVRLASDFLMSLQLTGAFREDLLSNLQIRMPIIVIGGGLTAVDCAVEVQKYYYVQIRKFVTRLNQVGKERLFQDLTLEEKNIADEFISDFELLKNLKDQEVFPKVKIIYRKSIQESPAYQLNHQELQEALNQNIEFIENATPIEALIDDFGHIKSLKCSDGKNYDCRSLIVAAGTTANISPVREDGLDLPLNNGYFTSLNNFKFINKIDQDNRAVSFLGDLHKSYEGNVVHAMTSAKEAYKEIEQLIQKRPVANHNLFQKIDEDFVVKIEKIEKLSDYVTEITIKAPLLTKKTSPGQIFRLQNYHQYAQIIDGQIMAMEGIAITALNIDHKKGTISGILLNYGGSTSLVNNFKAKEPCIFMGPSGRGTEIPKNETILVIGAGRGNQPLSVLSKLFTQNNCKVIFIAGYKKNEYIVRQKEIEEFSYRAIFTIEEKPALKTFKSSTIAYQGTIIDFLKNHDFGDLKIDRLFVIANDILMDEVAKIRHTKLNKTLANAKIAIASLNSSMQCMLKGVCAQCLQKRNNSDGKAEYFYSCANQDQDMDTFDFVHLRNRCQQNSASEKLTRIWIEHLKSQTTSA